MKKQFMIRFAAALVMCMMAAAMAAQDIQTIQTCFPLVSERQKGSDDWLAASARVLATLSFLDWKDVSDKYVNSCGMAGSKDKVVTIMQLTLDSIEYSITVINVQKSEKEQADEIIIIGKDPRQKDKMLLRDLGLNGCDIAVIPPWANDERKTYYYSVKDKKESFPLNKGKVNDVYARLLVKLIDHLKLARSSIIVT